MTDEIGINLEFLSKIPAEIRKLQKFEDDRKHFEDRLKECAKKTTVIHLYYNDDAGIVAVISSDIDILKSYIINTPKCNETVLSLTCNMDDVVTFCEKTETLQEIIRYFVIRDGVIRFKQYYDTTNSENEINTISITKYGFDGKVHKYLEEDKLQFDTVNIKYVDTNGASINIIDLANIFAPNDDLLQQKLLQCFDNNISNNSQHQKRL